MTVNQQNVISNRLVSNVNCLSKQSLLIALFPSDMAVASVNISQIKLLGFPDILGDDFSKNSFHPSGRVIRFGIKR